MNITMNFTYVSRLRYPVRTVTSLQSLQRQCIQHSHHQATAAFIVSCHYNSIQHVSASSHNPAINMNMNCHLVLSAIQGILWHSLETSHFKEGIPTTWSQPFLHGHTTTLRFKLCAHKIVEERTDMCHSNVNTSEGSKSLPDFSTSSRHTHGHNRGAAAEASEPVCNNLCKLYMYETIQCKLHRWKQAHGIVLQEN